MMRIMKCVRCGSYTLKDVCCNEKTISPRPAKFSIEDKYAVYRRKAKSAGLVSEGLL